jgi:hypothetical protein
MREEDEGKRRLISKKRWPGRISPDTAGQVARLARGIVVPSWWSRAASGIQLKQTAR